MKTKLAVGLALLIVLINSHVRAQLYDAGYGYMGIAVALLGRNHPAGVFISAILFGAIIRGGLLVDVYSDKISKDVVYVIQGILILFLISGELWKRIKRK